MTKCFSIEQTYIEVCCQVAIVALICPMFSRLKFEHVFCVVMFAFQIKCQPATLHYIQYILQHNFCVGWVVQLSLA